MPTPVYITDPVVAAAYFVHPGEWASVADDAEAQWLLDTHQGYPIDGSRAMPAAHFVHPDAPQPFVPYGGAPEPPDRVPANMTATIANPDVNFFTVTFGGSLDTVDAEGHFGVLDEAGATLADVTYMQPAGTAKGAACGLLLTALAPITELACVKNGSTVLEIRGIDPVVVGVVAGGLTIPGG